MSESVDLTNCDQEPIHVPGSIQPHGWMLVSNEAGQLVQGSANVTSLMGRPLDDLLGLRVADLCGPLSDARLAEMAETGEVSDSEIGGRRVAISAHRSGHATIIELEPAETEPLAIERHLPTLRGLQKTRGVQSTLQYVAEHVRAIIGYDRVMIYRFLPDLCGEVIAESAAPELTPYLGLRYPASDIPAQARRLYRLNLVRLIVDARYEPVPLVPVRLPDGSDLDLSFAMLRSVSPIHREYLQNMGITASFSISIVIDDRLWGLIACHHRQPRFIPHDRRSFCELLAQQIANIVDAEERRMGAQAEEQASAVALTMAERIASQEEIVSALISSQQELLGLVGAAGAVVTLGGRTGLMGATPPRTAIDALISHLKPDVEEFHTHEAGRMFPMLAPHEKTAAGVLGCRIHAQDGWIIWFRPEAASTIRWAGDPQKNMNVGPLGTRLTPRGSFEEYVATTAGQSEWWSPADQRTAKRMRSMLRDALLRQSMEASRLREIVIGTMGHDLRTPLSAITIAAALMKGEGEERGEQLAAAIRSSSHRMKRLLDNLMEMSRIQAGVGIHLTRTRVDLGEVAGRLAAEARLGSGGAVNLSCEGDLVADVDEVRMEQVLANLLSNARHHGDPVAPIDLDLRGGAEDIEIAVHNRGPVIPPSAFPHLFTVYVSRDLARGLGLGLYTVQHIVRAHGGTIEVQSTEEDGTVFRIRIPRS